MNKRIDSIKGISCFTGEPINIKIDKGRIQAVETLPETGDDKQKLISPGFIDNQVNGFASVSFTDENLTVDKVTSVTENLWKYGVTGYLPTLTTSSREQLLANLQVLAKAIKEDVNKNSIPGIHLEGPYISPEKGYRGAHPKKYIRKPDWEEFTGFQKAAQGNIIQITLAPEIEGSLKFIEHCVDNGIIVALGHHNGSTKEIKSAVKAGARIATHFGNACANYINRHKNPLWPQLANEELSLSLIADGIHLTEAEIDVFYKAKGIDKIILTSDVTKFAGMPPDNYEWNGQQVKLTEEGRVLLAAENMLAGSALPLLQGLENFRAYTDCSLSEVIQTVTHNPSELYHLKNSGAIAAGNSANLVQLKAEDKIEVEKTILKGELVYEKV